METIGDRVKYQFVTESMNSYDEFQWKSANSEEFKEVQSNEDASSSINTSEISPSLTKESSTVPEIEVGMLLEYLNPKEPTKIQLVRVLEVLNDGFFTIGNLRISTREKALKATWNKVVHYSTPNLFNVGFGGEHEIPVSLENGVTESYYSSLRKPSAKATFLILEVSSLAFYSSTYYMPFSHWEHIIPGIEGCK